MRVIEVWDTTAANRLATLEGPECDATVTRKINGSWKLVVEYPGMQANDKSVNFVQDNRMKVVDLDDSSSRTYVISTVEKERTQAGNIVYKVTADYQAIAIMADEGINTHKEFKSESPSTILSWLMGYSYFNAGTCQPTSPVDVTVSYESVMSGLQKLLKATGAYWDVDEAPAFPEVDLLTALGTDNYVRITVGENLKNLRQVSHTAEIKNKIYGIGGGEPPVTIANATHKVDSYAAGVITTKGNKVVPADDHWNTYKVKFINGTLAANEYTVSDCTHGAVNDTLTLSGAPAGVTADDSFVILVATNNPVSYIHESPGDKVGFHNNSQWQDVINYVKFASLSGTYSAGLCAGWNGYGAPSLSENTGATYIKYGTKSQRVQASGTVQGIYQRVQHNTPNTVFSFVANVYVVSGSVALALSASVTTGYFVFTDQTGWQTLVIEGILDTTNYTDVYLLSVGGAAEFYVDSVQVTTGEKAKRFTANSDKKALWDETLDVFNKLKSPRVTYAANFIDLFRIDRAANPYREISIGDTVHVIDPDLGIDVDVTVVEQRDKIFEPEKMESVISNE